MSDDLLALRQALLALETSSDVQHWLVSNIDRIVQAIASQVVVQLEEPHSDEPSLSISIGSLTTSYVPLFDVIEESFRWHGATDGEDPLGILQQSYARRQASARQN